MQPRDATDEFAPTAVMGGRSSISVQCPQVNKCTFTLSAVVTIFFSSLFFGFFFFSSLFGCCCCFCHALALHSHDLHALLRRRLANFLTCARNNKLLMNSINNHFRYALSFFFLLSPLPSLNGKQLASWFGAFYIIFFLASDNSPRPLRFSLTRGY